LARRFDTTFLIDVLHYWPEDEQRALLKQVAEALVPGGRLFLRDGCAGPDGGTGKVHLGEWFTTLLGFNPGTGTLCFLTEEHLRVLLVETGFTVEDYIDSGAENRLWRCRRN
jgi:SAM-dependent methyltransferase